MHLLCRSDTKHATTAQQLQNLRAAADLTVAAAADTRIRYESGSQPTVSFGTSPELLL
eukprot:SAG11_NODE_23697_length_384_cov_1.003509_2_plen_57_part_01